jgi:hypothetical protein
MASVAAEMTLHVKLSGQDRELLERVSENIEWYREHVKEPLSDRAIADLADKVSAKLVQQQRLSGGSKL